MGTAGKKPPKIWIVHLRYGDWEDDQCDEVVGYAATKERACAFVKKHKAQHWKLTMKDYGKMIGEVKRWVRDAGGCCYANEPAYVVYEVEGY